MNCLQRTRSDRWTRTSNNLCQATSRFFFEPTPANSSKKKAAWSKNSIFPESSTSQSRSKLAL